MESIGAPGVPWSSGTTGIGLTGADSVRRVASMDCFGVSATGTISGGATLSPVSAMLIEVGSIIEGTTRGESVIDGLVFAIGGTIGTDLHLLYTMNHTTLPRTISMRRSPPIIQTLDDIRENVVSHFSLSC